MSVVETSVGECALAKFCLKLHGPGDDDVRYHVHVNQSPEEGYVDIGVDPLRGIINSVLWPYAPVMQVRIFGKQVVAHLDGDAAEAKERVVERLEDRGYKSVDVT